MNPLCPDPKPWPVVGFLMALCFISHLNRVSMAVAADERIMKQFSISPTAMGTVYSAFLLVYTLGMIPGGFFLDRVGSRLALTVMGFGSALFVLSTGAVGFAAASAAQVWVSLLIVRSLMGLVTTPLHPASARAVSQWVPPARQTFANGLVTGAALLGIACTYKVFGTLIDWLDWPGAFVVCGGATALLTTAWMLSVREPSRQTDDATDRRPFLTAPATGWLQLLRDRNLVLLTLSYAAVGYFQYLFFYWIHYYFESVLHLGKDQSRWYAGLPMLAMALCMPLGGWWSDRLQRKLGFGVGRKIIAAGGLVLSALFLGLALVTRDTGMMVAWFSLSLGSLGLSEGPFWLTAVEMGGRRGGTAAAVMNTGGNGIGLLAPLVTPYISEHLGWTWGISLGGLVALLGALCWWLIRFKPAALAPEP